MAYASASNAAALCQNVLSGASNFSTSTSPALAAVNVWLTSGCAVLESTLAGWGYNVPPGSNTAAYGWLADLNALYAAAKVELSRTNITLGPGERTRGQVFEQMFWDGLDRMRGQDLSRAGLARSSDGRLYVGGVSVDDKDIWDEDTDRVRPRFRRDQFAFGGTLRPSGISASERG